jgi:hypothetical protein
MQKKFQIVAHTGIGTGVNIKLEPYRDPGLPTVTVYQNYLTPYSSGIQQQEPQVSCLLCQLC